MKTTRLTLLFLMTTLILTSCTKDTPTCCDCPVPYSETGRNIIGCKMDGDPWRICYKGDLLKAPTTAYRDNNYSRDYWEIKCTKKNENLDEIMFIDFNDPKVGAGIWIGFEYFSNDSLWTKGVYNVDKAFPYHMKITHFDTINRIVSGRFECTLKLSGTTDPHILDTITITDGVFDTHY